MATTDPTSSTTPAGQAGDISTTTIMRELFDLYCIATGTRALAMEAGQGEVAHLAKSLADRLYGLRNRIDEADVAGKGGAA
jgi:hypothetical protein